MALITYPQILYGWTVTAGVSDTIHFHDATTAFVATLTPGVYYPTTYAAEVQAAMRRANTNNQNNTCTFSYSTLQFTLTGTATFSIEWTTGTNDQAVANQLGFDKTVPSSGGVSYTGTSAVGGVNSSAFKWTFNEPAPTFTPISAQAAAAKNASPALLLQRQIRVMQNKSDGGSMETVYLANFRRFRISLNQVKGANEDVNEQTNLELFLDWAMKGQVFSYQPDKTSANVAAFVLDLQRADIANTFSWVTRDEADYGELVFVEQT